MRDRPAPHLAGLAEGGSPTAAATAPLHASHLLRVQKRRGGRGTMREERMARAMGSV